MNTITLIKNARILTPHGFILGNVLIENGIIQSITKEIPKLENDAHELNAKFKMLLPGFIDIHTHGANGLDVNGAVADDYVELNKFFASKGTTSYLPTVISDDHQVMISAINAIVSAMIDDANGSQILGIHLEGPYLCSKYKGAMPEEFLRLPSFEEFELFQEAANGNIMHMTIAPDVEGSVDFIRHITRAGVSTAIGHTDATYEQTMDCIYNGANHSTHTFNAMKMMHHRAPAVVGAILDSNITSEIICDGEHVDAAMVRILMKNKGVDNMIGVTDSIMAAGLPDGRYRLGVNEIDVENGNAWLADDHSTRAGSTLLMIDAFRNMIEFTDVSIADASKIFSRNPARVIGMERSKGEIRVGMDADFVLLDDDLNLAATIVMGNLCYVNLSESEEQTPGKKTNISTDGTENIGDYILEESGSFLY